MPRPTIYNDDAIVCIHSTGESSLQPNSDRMAIVQAIINNSGCMTLKAIDEHFGLDMRAKVAALCRSGWLELQAPEQG